jgi:PAS domain S-box-containing protein
MSNERILIVEDEFIVAEDIRASLEDSGYEVIGPASTAKEAIRFATEQHPDLILMDIVLAGDKNGIDVAEKVKNELDIPVIFLTAFSDDKMIERAKAAEPYGYLIKPFQDRELHSEIEIALYKHRMEARVKYLNSVLRSIRNVNQLIVQEKNPDRLIERACEYMTEASGISTAWICLDDNNGTIKKFASSGLDEISKKLKTILKEGGKLNCVDLVSQSENVQKIEFPEKECPDCPLSIFYEIQGALAIRLSHNDHKYGVLVVSVPKDMVHDKEQLSLFEEISGDISFALHGFEIDKRKKEAEESLMKSEENFQQVVSNIAAAVWSADIGEDGTFENQYTSPIYDELLGLPTGGTTNNWDKHLSYVKPEYIELVNAKFREAIESPGKIIDLDFEVLKENGQTAWLNSKGRCFEKNGKLSVFGSTQDITARKRAEEELRQYECIVSSSNDMMALLSTDFIYLAANNAYIHAFDKTRDEVVGHSVAEVFGEEFFETVIKPMAEQCINGDKVHYSDWFEFPVGGRQYMDIEYSPYLDNDKKVRGFVVVARDITDHKRAEDALKDSERRRSDWIGNSPTCTKILDLDFNLQFMSASGVRELGIDDINEFYGKPYPFNFYPDSFKIPMSKNLKKAKETGEIIVQEASVLDVHGNKLWYHSTIVPVNDDKGQLDYMMVVSLETTERKLAEEALEESEKSYRDLLSNLNAGVVAHASDTSVMFANSAACKFLGLTENQMKGKEAIDPHWKFLRDDGSPMPLGEYPVNQVISTKQQLVNLVVGVTIPQKADVVWVLVNGFPVFNDSGEIEQVIISFIDITDRKLAEEELQRSESRLSLALSGANQGTWDWSIKTEEVVFSERWVGMLGYEVGELAPNISTWESLLHPEDKDRVMQNLNRHFEDDAVKYETEFRLKTRSGEWKWIDARGRVFARDEDNKPLRMAGTHIDITERKKAEEEREKLLHNILERMKELQCIYGVSESIQQRDALEDILQDAVSLIPHGWQYSKIARSQILFDEQEYNSEPFEETEWKLSSDILVEGRRRGSVDVFYMEERPDLDEGPFYAEERKLLDGLARMLGETIEKKQSEKEKVKLEEHLRHQQKLESIGTLASGVAHEINNPINSILNFAELIKMKTTGDEQLADFTQRIINDTNRIAKIVKNLLSFARQDKEMHSPAFMADIVGDTLSLIAAAFRRDQTTITVDIPGDLPKIKCRTQQIQQVVMNILTNARDALNERYPESDENKAIKITCAPFEKEGEKWIRTTMENHGGAIPAEIIQRIFDPFFTTKPRDVGTGLGLSISYGIVSEHKGMLSVESDENSTSFHMDLRVNNGWTLGKSDSI